MHATSTGTVFLAHLVSDERDAFLGTRLERFTKKTIVGRGKLDRGLDRIRRDGYAVCLGELEESLFGASAAVLNEQQRPVAIVSVWGPEHRVPRARLADVGRRTRRAAQRLEGVLR